MSDKKKYKYVPNKPFSEMTSKELANWHIAEAQMWTGENIEENNCECKQWNHIDQKFLTRHHKHCPHYDPENDAAEIISSLLQTMRAWGAEEDGIPEFAYDVYNKAAHLISEEPLFHSKNEIT